MYKGKKVLAIITARGGSKGLPGKNIKELNGKPLIAWTIEQVRKSRFLTESFVSTDDAEIAEVCGQNGMQVPELRPKELARDDTTSVDVLLNVISLFEQKERFFDYVLLLEPTSPLRKDDDIDNMICMAIDAPEADGVISVGKVHMEHPAIVKKMNKDGYLEAYVPNGRMITQRQQEDEALFPYGVGYLMKTERLKETKTIYMPRMRPYFIERWQNYEVDDIFDFVCIEAVMKLEGIK